MAYLNSQEREQLAQKLSAMRFNQAKNHLWRLDRQARLRYLRSNQNVGKWETAFDLPGLGARVTLVETRTSEPKGLFARLSYEMVEVVVEATPENHA